MSFQGFAVVKSNVFSVCVFVCEYLCLCTCQGVSLSCCVCAHVCVCVCLGLYVCQHMYASLWDVRHMGVCACVIRQIQFPGE